MNVLISWSGERSKAIATALKEWLPDIIQSLEVWMSDSDIKAGDRWLNELNENLEKTIFGIICLTPENLHNDWILYEAGAISKFVEKSKVTSYLHELKQADVEFPLAQFQNVVTNKEDTLKLVQSLNQSIEKPMEKTRLKRLFEKFWPDLEKSIKSIPIRKEKGEVESPRELRDMVEEILLTVRNQNKTTVMENYNSRPQIEPNYLQSLESAKNLIKNGYKNIDKQELELLLGLITSTNPKYYSKEEYEIIDRAAEGGFTELQRRKSIEHRTPEEFK